MKALLAVIGMAIALTACDTAPVSRRDNAPASILPPMRWDAQRPEAQARAWTRASLAALEGHGATLAELVPADIETWCPGYAEATVQDRRAFWAGLFSALAKHESTWNPAAVGGDGRWVGLVQIAPATARGYGCTARSAEDLKDGAANLSCAIRIAARTVARDGVVAAGGDGIAADWGPFHSAAKRREMAAWTSSQSYCRG